MCSNALNSTISMRPAENPYRKVVLVCTNSRADGTNCCALRGAETLYERLKGAVKAQFTDVRVVRTSCLNNCDTGVSVVIMPDDIWLGEVTEGDIPAILERLE